ncbi:hypothetical protein BD410DRAFT_732286 [Rickenella mellea]|uniref:Uncharacterized protein n=1 Tax=Rickenella mellea TaxID=50990 RepID=A0A4Y7PJZ2_9AGAM|nr:hypothetical protein BD410DRAFT_732286 [Rickenella mellea]
MDTWQSDVYNHFKSPPKIIEVDGEVRYKFICAKENNTSESIFVTRARHDNSTSNLKRHVDECSPDDARATKILKDFLGGSTYNKAKFRFMMAIWIARRHHPFLISEDPELQAMFLMLCSKVDLPSRFTVSRDIKEIFAMSCVAVAKLLTNTPRSLHAGINGWTSPNII